MEAVRDQGGPTHRAVLPLTGMETLTACWSSVYAACCSGEDGSTRILGDKQWSGTVSRI